MPESYRRVTQAPTTLQPKDQAAEIDALGAELAYEVRLLAESAQLAHLLGNTNLPAGGQVALGKISANEEFVGPAERKQKQRLDLDGFPDAPENRALLRYLTATVEGRR